MPAGNPSDRRLPGEGAGPRTVQLGVIELHSDPALRDDFYATVEGLPGHIVDVWLLDIAASLARHGYTLTVTTERPVGLRGEELESVRATAQSEPPADQAGGSVHTRG